MWEMGYVNKAPLIFFSLVLSVKARFLGGFDGGRRPTYNQFYGIHGQYKL